MAMNTEWMDIILAKLDGLSLQFDAELSNPIDIVKNLNLRLVDSSPRDRGLSPESKQITGATIPYRVGNIVNTCFDENQNMDKVRTQEVLESLLSHKKNKRVKPSTLHTYKKHLNRFAKHFPWMPQEIGAILKYLDHFDGETGRYRRNQQDLIHMLYKHATCYFPISKNPLKGLERPEVTKMPIMTLSPNSVRLLDRTTATIRERVTLDLLLGHGWRQVEVRRILSADIANIRDGLILCRGKERQEWAPLLPETEERLRELAEGLDPTDHIFLSNGTYRGKRQPLGENGMSKLISRLYSRAGITGMTGHDLRRSFATLIVLASNDEFLAMRLLRDRVPGQSDRYINYPLLRLVEALKQYSPLRLIQNSDGLQHKTGARLYPGGDGGESKSPAT